MNACARTRGRRSGPPHVALAACLIAASLLLPLCAMADQSSKHKIEVRNFKDPLERQRLLDLAIEIDEEITRATGNGTTVITIAIEPGNSIRYIPNRELAIGLPERSPPHHELPRLVNYMLLRRIVQAHPDRQPRLGQVPAWIIAGVCHRVRDRRTNLLANSFYPAAHAAVNAGRIPTFGDLFDVRPTPDDGPIYYIYAEYCAILLRAMERDSRRSVDHVLAQLENDRTDYAVLLANLPEIASSESPAAWYDGRVRHAAVWLLFPADYQFARQRLASMQSISIMAPSEGQQAKTRTVDLMELSDGDFTYFHESQAFNAFSRNVFELQTHGPVLLRRPVEQFKIAVDAFENGEQDVFLYHLLEARRQSEFAILRGEAIIAYLDQVETGPDRTLLRRFAEYRYSIFHDLQPTDFELQVDIYIDQLMHPDD